MVGTRRLELLTSTVSKSIYAVLPTTYRSLETAEERRNTRKPDFQQVILQAKKKLVKRNISIHSSGNNFRVADHPGLSVPNHSRRLECGAYGANPKQMPRVTAAVALAS